MSCYRLSNLLPLAVFEEVRRELLPQGWEGRGLQRKVARAAAPAENLTCYLSEDSDDDVPSKVKREVNSLLLLLLLLQSFCSSCCICFCSSCLILLPILLLLLLLLLLFAARLRFFPSFRLAFQQAPSKLPVFQWKEEDDEEDEEEQKQAGKKAEKSPNWVFMLRTGGCGG